MVAAGDESSSSVSSIWVPRVRKIRRDLIFAEPYIIIIICPLSARGRKVKASERYTVAKCLKEKIVSSKSFWMYKEFKVLSKQGSEFYDMFGKKYPRQALGLSAKRSAIF